MGKEAKESALDNGYVFANIKDTGIRVRKQPSTEAEIVKNVYHNENYAIKSFSKDGNWIKIKIKGVGSGWIAEQFAKVSINMDTAITLKEEREMIRRQREEEERQRQQAAAAQNNNTDTNTNTNTDTGSSSSSNNYSYGDSGSASSGGQQL